MHLRTIPALLLSIAIPMPAFAQPHTIAQLGTAPLVGEITSTAQLQADVARERQIFETAGEKLGLTPDEYARFEAQLTAKRLAYVTLPRHLDAMSWSSGGRVYVLHDVFIPANTKGWEIDVHEGRTVVALFIPARCGNLSVVRKTLPLIAQATPPPAKVEAAATLAPAPPRAQVVALPPAPQATLAPYQSAATTTGPAHHFNWWPLLLIPIAALFFHGGSTSPAIGTAPALSTMPTIAAPTPQPVVGCTPTPH
jgi:hypothetical protein